MCSSRYMYILFILFSFYSANISQRVFHVVFPFPHSPSLRLCSVISNGTRLHLPVSRLLKISDCCFCCCCWLLFIFGAHQKPTLHFQFRNIAWSLVWVWFAWLFLSFFLFFSFVFFFFVCSFLLLLAFLYICEEEPLASSFCQTIFRVISILMHARANEKQRWTGKMPREHNQQRIKKNKRATHKC